VLDLCDKLGILVIGEMYDKWEITWPGAATGYGFSENYREDLTYFIKRDINHPSVIAWSVGNETIEQREDPVSGIKWYSELASIVRETDSSRSITCALHPGYADKGDQIPSNYIYIEPLVSYNYRTDSFAAWHERYPEMVWLAAETKPTQNERPDDFGDINYDRNSWQKMDDFVAGQFIWAGIDYLGESPGWPLKGFYNGLLKTNAETKPFAYYTQSVYSEDPMVKITVVDQELVDSLNNSRNWQNSWSGAPVVRHWNFNKPGDSLHLVIFTNCQEVELIINDSLLNYHFKNNYTDGVIKTPVFYEPGMISAVGYYTDEQGNKLRVTDSILTALKPSMIKMDPDKTEMIADGLDVVHIRTSVTDSIGVVHPEANHMINYEIQGQARIRVIDNGDPTDHTPPASNQKRVHNGTQLLIIQSTLEPGDLIISASAKGLKPASVSVKSVPPENRKSKPIL
jgi:beta-galactosidase